MNFAILLKTIDKLLRWIPFPKVRGKNVKIKKVIILRPGGLGDAFLLLKPLSNFISQNNLVTDVLCEDRNKSAFSLINNINKIYSYNNKNDLKELIVKYNDYDLAIDTEQFHILSSFTGRYLSQNTAGFGTGNRRKNLAWSIPYFHEEYEQDAFKRLFLFVSEKFQLKFHWQNVKYNFQQSDISEYDVIIFTGATVWQRKWETEKYINLIQQLEKYELKIALAGGKSELSTNSMIHSNCRNVDNLTDKLSINELGYTFGKSKLLFSTDSGVLHLGAIAGIKTVSMFGSGIQEKWAPKGENHIVINKNLPCSPCTRFGYMKKCKIDAKCMRDIGVDDIICAIMTLLKIEDKR